MDQAVMIDVHQHPFVLPDDMDRFIEFLRANDRYHYGYQAVQAGGWSTVTTAQRLPAGSKAPPICPSMEYEDIAAEVGGMLADVAQQDNVVRVTNADEILSARQQGRIGFLPTLEHLAIGNRIERVDALYGMGVRPWPASPTTAATSFGDGQTERNPRRFERLRRPGRPPHERPGHGRGPLPRLNPHRHGRHRNLPRAHRLQPQRLLHPASQWPHSQGRGTAGLRPQRRTGLHHRRAQLPQRRPRAGHRMRPRPLRLHGEPRRR